MIECRRRLLPSRQRLAFHRRRFCYKVNSMLAPVLWVDYLSGNTDSDRTGSFDTLYATNHKSYGYMNRFIAVPKHNGGGGLLDLAVKNKTAMVGGSLEVALHEFLLANEDSAGRKGPIGLEADVIFTVPVHPNVKVQEGRRRPIRSSPSP